MTYNNIKRFVLTFILCLFAAAPCFAQNNIQAMRFLTINALMEYGQRLYDRGDFNEATAVFNHVLTYDSHDPRALQYLKDMGHPALPHISPVIKSQASRHIVPAQDIIVVKKSNEQIINKINVLDTENLKQAIAVKKDIIEKLKDQIAQMKASIASQTEN